MHLRCFEYIRSKTNNYKQKKNHSITEGGGGEGGKGVGSPAGVLYHICGVLKFDKKKLEKFANAKQIVTFEKSAKLGKRNLKVESSKDES